MAKKKTVTQAKEETEALIRELAIRTKEWALGHGCYRDEESGEILGYFVITKSKSKKPIWCEWSGENPAAWDSVLNRMLELGVPIVADSFNGHYIGRQGEQGAKVGTAVNNTVTRAETVKRHTEAIYFSGQWQVSVDALQNRLRADLKDADPLALLTSIEQLLSGAGVPVQRSFAQLILEAKREKKDEEATDDGE